MAGDVALGVISQPDSRTRKDTAGHDAGSSRAALSEHRACSFAYSPLPAARGEVERSEGEAPLIREAVGLRRTLIRPLPQGRRRRFRYSLQIPTTPRDRARPRRNAPAPGGRRPAACWAERRRRRTVLESGAVGHERRDILRVHQIGGELHKICEARALGRQRGADIGEHQRALGVESRGASPSLSAPTAGDEHAPTLTR